MTASITALETASTLERLPSLAGRQKQLRVPRSLRRLSGVVLLLAGWALSSWFNWLPTDILPSPRSVVLAMGELLSDGQLVEALGASLTRVVIGCSIGIAAGVVAGLFSGLLHLGEDLIDAPVQMMRTLPWAGLIPLLIIWLGINEASKIALVALASFFPIYLNLFAGIRNIDQNLIEASHTLGLGQGEIVRHVVLPGALPNALIGLRFALGHAWLALVLAETVNSQTGIGSLTTYARETYRTDIVLVCLLIYALLGLSTDLIVRFLEGRFLSWRPSFKAA
ncbi:ABC transporter permease [Novosphingobium terrae]|uniref:ABC transporter permease n=1 Tax=Novosphingobium terrae TaxID=2726189 RepID=UPI0019817891|nr:ABC transporter permease [Novosphingobium terrae]